MSGDEDKLSALEELGVRYVLECGGDKPGLAKTEPSVEALADAVAARVVAQLGEAGRRLDRRLAEPEPALLSIKEAAKLLGITPNAMQLRIANHLVPGACIVRAGGRVHVHKARLLAALDKKAARQ